MRILRSTINGHAQTAIEYLLILAVAAAVVLVSFKFLLPKIQNSSQEYYNNVAQVVSGNKIPLPINGAWCNVECPTTGTGNPTIYRTCECPAPAFGGVYCPNDNFHQGSMTCRGDTCTCGGQILLQPCASGQSSTANQPCTCIPGPCSALTPTACGQITYGTDGCGGSCFKQGPPCP